MSANLVVHNQEENLVLADKYAQSDFTPEGFKGKPANALIAIDIANRSGSPVLEVMNNIFIDRSGRIGFQAPYVISMANRLGPFSSLIDWETEKLDNDIAVSAFATLNDKIVSSPKITIKMANDAGWMNNSKGKKPVWVAQPIQMLKYKAALMLIKAYCAEVMFGLQTDIDLQIMENEQAPKSNAAVEAMTVKVESE
ncbi:MAG: hypothetical protein AB8G05_01305 [Oligoflexales bacterium]